MIPFEKISTGRQSLESSLDLRARLQPLLQSAVLSVGTLIELEMSFRNMREEKIFKVVSEAVSACGLDVRSQLNYALVLFSTGKVIISATQRHHVIGHAI